MAKLTPKQQQIYDYILAFANEHGYPPSVREIAQAVGLKDVGVLEAGKRADLLVLDGSLNLEQVYIDGNLIGG